MRLVFLILVVFLRSIGGAGIAPESVFVAVDSNQSILVVERRLLVLGFPVFDDGVEVTDLFLLFSDYLVSGVDLGLVFLG